MILVPRAVKVYFATRPTNLRKSFDGLTNEIRHTLGYDSLGGHVFVFLNRRKNQVKLIVWTRGGFTIIHKRLERGTFTFPSRVTGDATSIAIDVHELAMLLEGDQRAALLEEARTLGGNLIAAAIARLSA